jgi:hypothetical protein
MQAHSEELDFVHPTLGRQVTAIGGHYVFVRERRLPYLGREIWYLIGYAVVDTSCCGMGGCAYWLVQGFILRWKYKKNDRELPVSRVEPIRDVRLQKDIRRLIQTRDKILQITFQ